MQTAFSFQPGPNATASGSSFQPKRKKSDRDDDEPVMMRSPPLKRRVTCMNEPDHSIALPELIPDHSNAASDDDVGMDQDTDQDMDSGSFMGNDLDERVGCGLGVGRSLQYDTNGTGGFGFGPGAEEDDMGDTDMGHSVVTAEPKLYPTMDVYPSLQPHPNPHHFSNIAPYTNAQSLSINGVIRPRSPLSAQQFSTSLPAPTARGLFQPTVSAPLAPNASAIERARFAHGPNCKSIPKLQMSPYPDPITGKQTLYSMCPDCGTVEKAA